MVRSVAYPPFAKSTRRIDWIRAKARFRSGSLWLRTKASRKGRSLRMMIIGCDFHPSWQQVSWLDTETGETGEQKLVHASGDAKTFYQQLAVPVRIGMEASTAPTAIGAGRGGSRRAKASASRGRCGDGIVGQARCRACCCPRAYGAGSGPDGR